MLALLHGNLTVFTSVGSYIVIYSIVKYAYLRCFKKIEILNIMTVKSNKPNL